MIIIINGTSSSGKSSVCQVLQRKLGDGCLNFGTDGYLSMLGNKFLELNPNNPDVCTPNDICYAKKHDDGSYEIVPGKLCSKLYQTIPDILDVVAKQGFNIVVDSFITTQDELKPYKERLAKYNMFFVYLYATEQIIESREETRGNRLKGSAIHWLKHFVCKDDHDIIVDTSAVSVEEICNKILNHIKVNMNTK